MSQIVTITKSFTFEASHVLPKHPGKCSRLHGHSWKLYVSVAGPVNSESGFVVDYAVLGELVKAHIVNVVDHQHLGQGDMVMQMDDRIWNTSTHYAAFGQHFYPSSENLVIAFAKILKPLTNELKVELVEVSLDETCTSKATWRPNA